MSRDISKNNPQLHLIGAKYCEKIRSIMNSHENSDLQNLQVMESCIRFFSQCIKYLPECNNDVLTLCRFYLEKLKMKEIEVDHVVINRVIGICTTMMIQRKEETIIRATCLVLKEILKIIPSNILKSIVLKHSKSLSFIFQKIYLVQTYITQMYILEIFVIITKDLENLRNETIIKNQLLKKATPDILSLVIDRLNNIDCNDSKLTSQNFLKFFNNNLFQKTCILTMEGRIMEINDHAVEHSENILTTFNGRNLTVSLLVPQDFLAEKNTTLKSQALSQMKHNVVFIEFECIMIDAEEKNCNNKKYIDINILVKQAQIHDDNHIPVSLDELKEISIRLVEDEFLLKRFMDIFYEKFNKNEKMINDNTSIVDKESTMTFQTSASMIEDLKNFKEQETHIKKELNHVKRTMPYEPEIIIKNEEQKKCFNPETERIKKVVQKRAKKTNDISKDSEINVRTRPKREVRKVDYSKIDVYDEDNISEYEHPILTYHDFKMEQKKFRPKRNLKSTSCYEEDDDNDYYFPSVEIVTQTTTKRKRKTTKINQPKKIVRQKKIHYDTDDDVGTKNIKICEKQGSIQTKTETKTRKSKLNLKKKDNKDKENGEVKKTVEQNISDTFDALKEHNKPLIVKTSKDNNVSIEPVQVKFQVSVNKSKDSLTLHDNTVRNKNPIVDGRKVLPLRNHNINTDFANAPFSEYSHFDALDKTDTPKKILSIAEVTKRKLSIDDILNSPSHMYKKAKVEEWLQSTSSSFGVENDQVPPNSPVNVKKYDQKTDDIKLPEIMEDEDTFLNGIYINDEHQHCSSSSQISFDSDNKKSDRAHAITAIDKTDTQLDSQLILHDQSQNDFKNDPCASFHSRSKDIAAKLYLRKKQLEDNEKQIFKKYDRLIEHWGQKYLDQATRTKTQLKAMSNLRAQYESAKLKLIEEVTEQEKLSDNFARELGKRREAFELHNQIKKKELMNLKKEAARKNEELMHEVWREYVDNFQANFSSSIKKAYEI